MTDGPGNYGNSEQCTFRAEADLVVTTPQYDVELVYDYLKLNLCSNTCGSANNGACEDGGTGATSSDCSHGSECACHRVSHASFLNIRRLCC